MKQRWICGPGSRASAWLMLPAIFCGFESPARAAQAPLAASAGNIAGAPALSAESLAWLHTAISSGSLPDLRWPDFSDYSKHVKKFYELNGDSLWWVKNTEPTAQARQLIALILQAEQKGLSADDYDASRWNDRLAKLK